MTTTNCPSAFLNVPCQLHTPHTTHLHADSCGHITAWTDNAADTKEKAS